MTDFTFGQRVYAARLFHAWTLQELADKVGTSRGYIHDIENDRRQPSPKMVKALAEALDFAMTDGKKTWSFVQLDEGSE